MMTLLVCAGLVYMGVRIKKAVGGLAANPERMMLWAGMARRFMGR